MKKISKNLLIILSFIVVFCTFNNNFVYAVEVTGISINEGSTIELQEGQAIPLSTTITPQNATDKRVTWKSSNGGVVSVKSETGRAVGRKIGNATITATSSNGKTATIKVQVVEKKSENADDWIISEKFDTGDKKWVSSSNSGDSKLENIGRNIIGPIQVIGSLVSVIAIIIIGIRYMLGSVEEKAQYKETLGPYFFGAVLVFGVTNILAIVYNIANSI